MKCKRVETKLMDYLDGSLAPGEREEVALHAETCSSCAERVQGFSDVFGLLDSWRGVTPSPSFDARLERRLEQDAASGWLGRLFPGWAPLPLGKPAFAIALLFVISLAAVLVGYSPVPARMLASQRRQPLAAAGAEDLTLYRDLPVLEDLEVLRNFDVLAELSNTDSLRQ